MTSDEEWLSSQIPPSYPQTDDPLSNFLLPSTESRTTTNSNPHSTWQQQPLTVILAKPGKKKRTKKKSSGTTEKDNDSDMESQDGTPRQHTRRKQAEIIKRQRKSAYPSEPSPVRMPISPSLLAPSFHSLVSGERLSHSTATNLQSDLLRPLQQQEGILYAGDVEKTGRSVIYALRHAVGVFTKQLEKMQQSRMIVFLEDYNNYRALSRFVPWRHSSQPLLNDVLELVMKQEFKWSMTDLPNTIVCCGWTNRQTIHVLKLEDMQTTHPHLVNNLITFTHWVNNLCCS